MFLATRELRHSPLRFALIGAILALVAWLVFLLSGLANGLSVDNGAFIHRMPADHLVLQGDVRHYMHRSILAESTVAAVAAVPGVKDATPLGQLTITVRRAGGEEQVDATMLALDPVGFLSPKASEGRGLNAGSDDAVLDDTFRKHGVKVGDRLEVLPVGRELTVVGFVKGQKYNHLPVVFSDLEVWRDLRFAAPGSSGGIEQPISAVATRMEGDAAAAVAAKVPGVEVIDRAAALRALPGFKEEMGTLSMMQGFLFVIAAFILAVFFYVLTLQKSNQIGVLKALGASTGFLHRDLVMQVLVLTVAGIAVGAALALLVAAVLPAGVPFALDTRLLLTYSGVLVLAALLSTVLSIRRIAAVDPLVAIGRQD